MTTPIVRDFMHAWNHTRKDDFASRLARQSLIASTHGIPELESALDPMDYENRPRHTTRSPHTGSPEYDRRDIA